MTIFSRDKYETYNYECHSFVFENKIYKITYTHNHIDTQTLIELYTYNQICVYMGAWESV